MKLLLHKTLWENIRNFPIDQPESNFPFSKKLQQENNWTSKYTQRTIDEYRKFIFLCCVLPRGASPSDEVDKVWHLHLTYTQNYWTKLCKETLHKDIHHYPSRGGPTEKAKHDNWYQETLKAYREIFDQPPPEDIWPPPNNDYEIVFDTYDQKILTKTILLFITISLLYLIALSLFSLKGPDFLEAYFSLCIAAFASSVYLQRHKIKRLRNIVADYFPHNATVYQLSNFFFGKHRCYQTMLVDLIRNSEIKTDGINFIFTGQQRPEWQKEENPLLEQLYKRLAYGDSFSYMQGMGYLDAEQAEHKDLKIFQRLSQKRDYAQLIIPLFTIVIALIRMTQGSINHKPITYLFFEVFAFGTITAIMLAFFSYSRQVTKIAREIYSDEGHLDINTDKVTSAFSMAGMAALIGFSEYPLLKKTFNHYDPPNTAHSNSSGGCSSGGSSCGSGCGGGCGGCGS